MFELRVNEWVKTLSSIQINFSYIAFQYWHSSFNKTSMLSDLLQQIIKFQCGSPSTESKYH